MVPMPKSYHGCFLQEGRDASNSYDPNSGWIPVRRKYWNHCSPKFKIIDYINDPKKASIFKNYGQAETVVTLSSSKPPPQRTFVPCFKAPYSRKTPTKNKNRTPVLYVSKISNGHLEVLLMEYATIQDELKLHHNSAWSFLQATSIYAEQIFSHNVPRLELLLATIGINIISNIS